jgi:hypothetical protein
MRLVVVNFSQFLSYCLTSKYFHQVFGLTYPFLLQGERRFAQFHVRKENKG